MDVTSSNFQQSFLTVHRLSVCNSVNFDDFVIKADFHRVWLFSIILTVISWQNECKFSCCFFTPMIYPGVIVTLRMKEISHENISSVALLYKQIQHDVCRCVKSLMILQFWKLQKMTTIR